MSSTSSSCRISVFPHAAHESGSSTATVISPQSQYHTGIWCPHQSCRLMHQSRRLSVQFRNVRAIRGGTMRMRSSRMAALAALASETPGAYSLFTSTHHCSLGSGSMTSSQRSQRPTLCVYGSVFSRNPPSSRSRTIAARASSTVIPS